MRLLPGLITIGVSAQNGIPQYGPTSGDRCLSDRDDQTGKYTTQYSIESYNEIEERCNKTPGINTSNHVAPHVKTYELALLSFVGKGA